ncbi:MAG: choice-of-anchor tandem repeat GloVer-containing protein [Candidatus Korobacteraceae bacterium]
MERTKAFCRSVAIVGTLFFLSMIAQAQTLTVLHAFTGGTDGDNPVGAGVTIDRAGNLYGAVGFGGLQGSQCYESLTCGTIFKLSRHSLSWTFNILYSFHGPDGANPEAPLVFGPDGALYGTTFDGGVGCSYGCGNVFRLQPPATFCSSVLCSWDQTVLYQFSGGDDGAQPDSGALTFDPAGNLYGTTPFKGAQSCGTVFELAHKVNQWTFNLLWTFTEYPSGCSPLSGVIFDPAGNLYGTTTEGGANEYGAAFELSPSGQSWSLTPLHQFVDSSDGSDPLGNLIFDSAGNLFGTNRFGGPGGEGGIFELSPDSGGWNLSVLHSFHGEAAGPDGPVLIDSAGNLYATSSYAGKYGWGNVFKMTPSGSGYTYTDLYDFTGASDGGAPSGQIVMDASGNLYGTTEFGGITGGDVCGNYGCGTVWELTP